MRPVVLAFASILAAAASFPAHADPMRDTILRNSGIGGLNCGQFTSVVEKNPQGAQEMAGQWFAGYLFGYAFSMSDAYAVATGEKGASVAAKGFKFLEPTLGRANVRGLGSTLADFCKQSPDVPLPSAVKIIMFGMVQTTGEGK